MDNDWYWHRNRWDGLPLPAVRPLWCDAGEWPPDWMEEPPVATKEVLPPEWESE